MNLLKNLEWLFCGYFSAWLQEREVDPIIEETEPWSWLHELVEKYNEELEDDGRVKEKS